MLDVPGADEFARDGAGALLTPEGQLAHFNSLNSAGSLSMAVMQLYSKSRGLFLQLNKADTINAVIKSMEREVQAGRFLIVDPADGKHEKHRMFRLWDTGVLFGVNAPGLMPAPCPSFTDSAWRYVRKEDIDGMSMLHVLYDWHDLFYKSESTTSAQLRKGVRKITCGRAYHCITTTSNEYMFVVWSVDRSQIKATQTVLLVFRMPVGRDADSKQELVAAKCYSCAAGENHGACSHILTGLNGLVLIQSRVIVAGDIGSGNKFWGPGSVKKTSSVPVQPITRIALLTGSGKLTKYTGFQPGAPALKPVMNNFIKRFQELAKPNVKPTIVELHAGVKIERKGGGQCL